MTIEEAIRQLKSLRCDRESFIYPGGGNNEIYEDDIAAIDAAIELIQKQIPKKPIWINDTFLGDSVMVCPSCKTRGIVNPFRRALFDYCPDCGQKLDWSDEE